MRKQLKVLLTTAALFTLAGEFFGPIYAVFVEEIGGDLLTAGAAYSVFAIISGVLIFLISRWEDHVKHQERLVVASYGLSCFGFLGYLFIKTPIDLFIVQIIFGIGEAIGTPAYDGLYSRFLERGKFVSEWGAWESMYWIVTGIAALTGGYLANLYGFKFIFTIMFVIALIGFCVSTFLVIDQNKK